MLNKSQIKHIKSLAIKKYRQEHHQFVIEGAKIVEELLQSNWQVDFVIISEDQKNKAIKHPNMFTVPAFQFETMSQFKNPSGIMAVVKMPKNMENVPKLNKGYFLALDQIQDPGNLGTIIRIADWYGISDIFCSHQTVDLFNAKTLQSSMGSFLRVKLHYLSLEKFLKECSLPIYATTLDGKNFKEIEKGPNGIILIGNEANGINANLIAITSEKITIPKNGKAESLNAAVACGIFCDFFCS